LGAHQSYAFLGVLWILFILWEADAAAAALRTLNVQGDKIRGLLLKIAARTGLFEGRN
jgi:hypothetical protein